jgi:hypothetical protein
MHGLKEKKYIDCNIYIFLVLMAGDTAHTGGGNARSPHDREREGAMILGRQGGQ